MSCKEHHNQHSPEKLAEGEMLGIGLMVLMITTDLDVCPFSINLCQLLSNFQHEVSYSIVLCGYEDPTVLRAGSLQGVQLQHFT